MQAEWLTIPQTAARIRQGRSTIYGWIADGLNSIHVDGVQFVRLDLVLAWRDQHGRRRGRARDYR
jgi:hypothetical protein